MSTAFQILLLSPLVFSVRNLDSYNASIVLERFFSLVGIILLTPIILPEQDNNIREVVSSHYTSLTGITAMRFFLILPILPVIVGVLCAAMTYFGSEFPFAAWWFGGTVSAFFLGTLGFSAFCLTGNWVAGYLAPICYFTLNIGGGAKLGRFYLFSLGKNSLSEKYWLLGTAAILLVAAFILIRHKKI